MTAINEAMTFSSFLPVLVGAALTGLLCGALSPYLVWKRLGLLSDSVSHASLMVIALALVFNLSESFLLIPFSVIIGLLLSYLQKKNYTELDSAIAIFFAGFMGIGLIIMQVTGKGSEEVLHALFGDVQNLTYVNIAILALLTVGVLGYLYKFKTQLRMALVQPDLAKVEGITVEKHMTILLVLCSVTVAVCLQLMGIILITMLLVAPSMTALSYARSSRAHARLSLIFGLTVAVAGAIAGTFLGWPVSASIATLGFAMFIISVLIRGRAA